MRILMTGCSSGVGRTISTNLVAQGHSVLGVGLGGPNIQWDFSSRDISDIWASKLVSEYAQFDVLINNAGMTHVDFLKDHETYDFAKVLRVNLIAAFTLSRAYVRSFLPENMSRGESHGRIINTSSMATKISMRGSPGYCASKAGLEALTKQMAKELAGKLPISVVAIGPASIENTAMSEQVITELQRTRGMNEEEARAYAMQSPMGRTLTHDEVWRFFDFFVNKAPLGCSGGVYHIPMGMGV